VDGAFCPSIDVRYSLISGNRADMLDVSNVPSTDVRNAANSIFHTSLLTALLDGPGGVVRDMMVSSCDTQSGRRDS